MYTIQTTDNNGTIDNNKKYLRGQTLTSIIKPNPINNKDIVISSLEKLTKRDIKSLCEENKNLLVFPNSFNEAEDIDDDAYVFKMYKSKEDYKLETGNIMGFIGIKNETPNKNHNNDIQILINSRFTQGDEKEKKDFFLHYILEKVFRINIVDLKFSINSNDSILDFLLYLFPYYLKKALNQGVYKEYQRRQYNNANVKGPINIVEHIKRNIPFNGKIAYSVREYSFDNNITQLIRHTIEYIRRKENGAGVLNQDLETRSFVNQIIECTQTYSERNRTNIINKNLKPCTHPYFTEYKDLQNLCLRILRHEKLKYSTDDKENIYGILFDGAWLWEEYLYTFLKDIPNLIHAENKKGKGSIPLFTDRTSKRYPDYYILKGEEGIKSFVLDAKYKNLHDKSIENFDRDDLHQIISYMYILEAKTGAFIFPDTENKEKIKQKKTIGYGGTVQAYGVPIPSNSENYNNFKEQMKKIEKTVKENIEEMIKYKE